VLTNDEVIKELHGFGRAKEELLPLCVDTFYRKGTWRGEKVFQRDGQGRVIALADRRENNDLVWKKIK